MPFAAFQTVRTEIIVGPDSFKFTWLYSCKPMHFMLTKKTITGLLVLTLVCLPAFAVFIDQGNAADNNNEGLSLAEAGKLKRALKYFKLAAQQDPNNPQYFNNAGVAQMRLGNSLSSWQIFVKRAIPHDCTFGFGFVWIRRKV